MKLNQKLLAKYNTKQSLIIITPYPKKGVTYGHGVGGLESFAKNVAANLAKLALKDRKRVVVLAQKIDGEPTFYEENNVLVIRCFQRNSFSLYAQIIKQLQTFNRVNNIAVQFEFAAYGNFAVASLFPMLLSALKAQGKSISIIIHQVLLNLADLSGHIGLPVNSSQLFILNLMLRQYYQMICMASDHIIVTEPSLKNRLAKIVPDKKIVAISHGVDVSRTSVSQKLARKKLNLPANELIIVSFGFITWYKGSDLLLKSITELQKTVGQKKIRIILAGGASETQGEKTHYQNYIQKVTKLAQVHGATITGFVKETDIKLYYAAADLIVFPYRTYMSSSGPLSLAYTYRRPFLLSKNLDEVLTATDYQENLRACGLTIKDLTFGNNKQQLAQKISTSLQSEQLKSLSKLAKLMRADRSYEVQAIKYLDTVYQAENKQPNNFSWARIYPKLALPLLVILTEKILR